ncbi:D-isomer specific 2-hydroxyacid dehydrogenase family protein [Acrocarpospora sp. B8E8]|uniref:2-hydroxyacid dehydrogenase n=1 Tax=Acrocarpospora sp. B8E8 TaxID=3153572 RepID=UPI00325CEADC
MGDEMAGRLCAVWLDEPTVIPPDFLVEVRRICEFRVFTGHPDQDEVVRRLRGADIAVVEWTAFGAELLERLESVRYLCLVTTAADHIDVAAAARRGIVVTSCPSYSAAAVAEYVLAGLVTADRSLPASRDAARRGESHLYGPFRGRGLQGATLGLVGVGRIGRQVAARAAAFGMSVVGCNRSGGAVPGVRMSSLAEVLRSADFVSVQVPYSPRTHHLLGARELDLLPSHAVLVNVSRARVLDEAEVAARLQDGRLRAAVVDDVADPGTSRLPGLPNAFVTTGIAWFTDSSIQANFDELIRTIRSCCEGSPINVLAALG